MATVLHNNNVIYIDKDYQKIKCFTTKEQLFRLRRNKACNINNSIFKSFF
jgi:hypothetical protein